MPLDILEYMNDERRLILGLGDTALCPLPSVIQCSPVVIYLYSSKRLRDFSRTSSLYLYRPYEGARS